MLRTLTTNAIINNSTHTQPLDRLMCFHIDYADALASRFNSEHSMHNLRLQFETYAPFKDLPREVKSGLFESYLRRCQRIRRISKHLTFADLNIVFCFDESLQIDVIKTLRTWLRKYLEINLPLIREYKIQGVVKINHLFRLGLIACDLQSCQMIWEQAIPEDQYSNLNPNQYHSCFDHLIANNALELCQWLWGKLNHASKNDYLHASYYNVEATVNHSKKTLLFALENKNMVMMEWLIACYKEVNAGFSIFCSTFHTITTSGNLEMCQWLWGKMTEQQQTAIINTFFNYEPHIINILANNHLAVIQWLKQVCNAEQVEKIEQIEKDKTKVFYHAAIAGNLDFCHQLWDDADEDTKHYIFQLLPTITTATNNPDIYIIFNNLMSYIWQRVPNELKDAKIKADLFFIDAFEHGTLNLCQLMWSYAETSEQHNDFRAKILSMVSVGIALSRNHLEVCKWLWSVADSRERQTIFNEIVFRCNPLSKECIEWVQLINEEIKSDKIKYLNKFLITEEHNSMQFYADVCQWQLSNLENNEQNGELTGFCRNTFIKALANFEFYMCEWIWQVCTPELRNYLIMNYDRHNHMNSRHVYDWLYDHTENDKQRVHLLQMDGYQAIITALLRDNLEQCKQLFALCERTKNIVINKAVQEFPKIILNGALSTAQWLWTVADEKQKASILSSINLQHIQVITFRGHQQLANWIIDLTAAALEKTLLANRTHSFWRTNSDEKPNADFIKSKKFK